METSVYNQYVDQFLYSAAAGDVDKVALCLKVVRNVDLHNEKGWTALMFAARNGHVEVVKLLMDAGCDVTLINRRGQTAAEIAAFWNHTDVADLLNQSRNMIKDNILQDNINKHIMFQRNDDKLDRASHRRKDKQWLDAQMTNDQSRFVIFVHLQPLIRHLQTDTNSDVSVALVVVNANKIQNIIKRDPLVIFLGLEKRPANQEKDNSAWFAIGLEHLSTEEQHHIDPESKLLAFYPGLFYLSEKDFTIFSQARSLLAWHDRYMFCPTCGGKTFIEDAGYKRTCVNIDCRSRQGVHNTCHPRIDPAVIVAVISPDRSKLLLARGRDFPPLLFSCLSGFMEPGESYEDTVRREVYEESSIRVDYIQYFNNKHWPVASSLLIGCFAYATDTDIKVDTDELTDARWFSKKEVIQMMSHDHPLGLFCPPKHTVAHQLVKTWITATSRL